jgi:site-specific DNA-adenine methylase
MRTYGVPYKGSKNRLAERIISNLPAAEHFYDLFAGGCAITHAALLSRKYKYVHANDIDGRGLRLFCDAAHGKYGDESRWISREDFLKNKSLPVSEQDAYVALCWSFSNNMKDYLYSRQIEQYRRACHYAVVFDDWEAFAILCPEVVDETQKALKGLNDRKTRRLELVRAITCVKKTVNNNIIINNPLYDYARVNQAKRTRQAARLQNLEKLGRLQSLQNMKALESLQKSMLDYRDVHIEPNAVVYCDIPYRGTDTGGYAAIDYDSFYDWCQAQTVPVYISEYDMPSDRFALIDAKEIRSLGNAKGSGRLVMEGLWAPKSRVIGISQEYNYMPQRV